VLESYSPWLLKANILAALRPDTISNEVSLAGMGKAHRMKNATRYRWASPRAAKTDQRRAAQRCKEENGGAKL